MTVHADPRRGAQGSEVVTDLVDALTDVLHVGSLTDVRRLSGGTSRETWAFTADGRPLVLQRELPRGARGAGMATQAALLDAAAAEGVPVPAVVATGTGIGTGVDVDVGVGVGDGLALGAAWIVLEHVEGETIPRKILRDDEFATARAALAAQCGEVLARIHRIDPARIGTLNGAEPLSELRVGLDVVGEPHPAFELGLRWLDQNRPPTRTTGVVHGDFRNGNLVVGHDGLNAVLDWELAHVGDPLEDLGWLCVRAWRFGATPHVGGFGEKDDLITAYEASSGGRIDREDLAWWEVLGTLKWGVTCMIQAATHLSGAVRSVELAAIGRRVCEAEHDLLDLLP